MMLLPAQGTGVAVAAALFAAVVASPLCPGSWRDAALVLLGILLGSVGVSWCSVWKKNLRPRPAAPNEQDADPHRLSTVEDLRKIMPAGPSGASLAEAKKVLDRLDDQMIDFVSKSPLLYLATVDPATNMPFCSPKGDAPGFVSVVPRPNGGHTLVVPDRPGNRLLFGLQNILSADDSKASALFAVPGACSTLRCGGTARASTDPALLKRHVARGCPPKVVISVDVDHAFFHCSKAYMRSRVWDPRSWPSKPPAVTFGRYFSRGMSSLEKKIDSDIEEHYRKVQKAIDGEACEEEG